jgi:bifunctional non-homologous end joining protein LigD
MAPTLREPFHHDGWVYEEKVDGWRMLVYKDGDRVSLVSRNGRDHTRRFADLAAVFAKLSARTLVLDGEVAITAPVVHAARGPEVSRSAPRRLAEKGVNAR